MMIKGVINIFGCMRTAFHRSDIQTISACHLIVRLDQVYVLKVQSYKLYNNKYMVASTQIT